MDAIAISFPNQATIYKETFQINICLPYWQPFCLRIFEQIFLKGYQEGQKLRFAITKTVGGATIKKGGTPYCFCYGKSFFGIVQLLCTKYLHIQWHTYMLN